MSKFLVNFFMIKTRLIVNSYTVTTLPFYYIIQKPWKALQTATKVRAKKFNSITGETIWTRDDTQVNHPFLEYGTYAEALRDLKDIYEPNRVMLGQRDVIDERVETDQNGIQTYYLN